MKIPDTFQLCGITWRVIPCDVITDMGQCCSETYTIRLRKDLSEQAKAATFCHELQHAVRYMAGESDHDERQVDAHGNLWHQLLAQLIPAKR